jgi:hypothetical protein
VIVQQCTACVCISHPQFNSPRFTLKEHMSLDASTTQVQTIQGRIQEARKRLAALNNSLGIEQPSADNLDRTAASVDTTQHLSQHPKQRPPPSPVVVAPESQPTPLVSRSVSFVSVSQASTASSYRQPTPPRQHAVAASPPPEQGSTAEIYPVDNRSPSIEAVQMSPLASPPQPAPSRPPSSPTRVDRFRMEREASRKLQPEPVNSPPRSSPGRAPSMSLDEMQDQLRRRIQNMHTSSRSASTVSTASNDPDVDIRGRSVASSTDTTKTAPQPTKVPAPASGLTRHSRSTTPNKAAPSRPTTPLSVHTSRSTSRPASPPPVRRSNALTAEQEAELAEIKKRCIKVALSGAEVFALLRLRGVIVSSGDTGERLLPPNRSHTMMLAEDEFKQLKQLRASLARQHRPS